MINSAISQIVFWLGIDVAPHFHDAAFHVGASFFHIDTASDILSLGGVGCELVYDILGTSGAFLLVLVD